MHKLSLSELNDPLIALINLFKLNHWIIMNIIKLNIKTAVFFKQILLMFLFLLGNDTISQALAGSAGSPSEPTGYNLYFCQNKTSSGPPVTTACLLVGINTTKGTQTPVACWTGGGCPNVNATYSSQAALDAAWSKNNVCGENTANVISPSSPSCH